MRANMKLDCETEGGSEGALWPVVRLSWGVTWFYLVPRGCRRHLAGPFPGYGG